MNNKQAAFAGVWRKYLPAIRILVKKAITTEQVLNINRSDLERAAGIKKSGYAFVVNFIKDKPEALYSGNDIVQAFIAVLLEDEVIRANFSNNDFAFSFSSKYQLQIKNNTAKKQVNPADAEEVLSN